LVLGFSGQKKEETRKAFGKKTEEESSRTGLLINLKDISQR